MLLTAAPKKVTEYIAERRENILVTLKPSEPLTFQSSMTVLIVDSPFFRVAEDFVCLGGFLEFIFILFIVGGFCPDGI